MTDGIRLAALIVIVTVSIPVLIITSQAKAQMSGFQPPIPYSAAATATTMSSDKDSSGVPSVLKDFAKNNPEQALYSAYDSQAASELDRCFGSPGKELCDGTVDLIVNSCKNSQVDLTVCHDPRIEELLVKA